MGFLKAMAKKVIIKNKNDGEDDWGEGASASSPNPTSLPRYKTLVHSSTAPTSTFHKQRRSNSIARVRAPPKKANSLAPALSRVGFKSTKELGQMGQAVGANSSDDDEWDDEDLAELDDKDLDNLDKLESTAMPTFLDSDDSDEEDGGIVFGNVGRKKTRVLVKAKVVRTPSFKMDAPQNNTSTEHQLKHQAGEPDASPLLPTDRELTSTPTVTLTAQDTQDTIGMLQTEHNTPLKTHFLSETENVPDHGQRTASSPPAAPSSTSSRIAVKNYQAMWNEQHGYSEQHYVKAQNIAKAKKQRREDQLRRTLLKTWADEEKDFASTPLPTTETPTEPNAPLEEFICEMPSYIPWKAELELRPGDGKIAFVGVQKHGPADLCGIKDGDVLHQVGGTQIKPRTLEQACQTIWLVKRNAQALSKKTCLVVVLQQPSARLHRQAVSVSTNSTRNNRFEAFQMGLNRIFLPTNAHWGLKLSRGVGRSVVVSSIAKSGVGRQVGIQKNDQILALLLPRKLGTTMLSNTGKTTKTTTRHILLSKLSGDMNRVRNEVHYAKQAADEDVHSKHTIEVVVYRPPLPTTTCWLGVNSVGFEMSILNGNTIVSCVHSSGSAFHNGVNVGDIVVSMDGVVVSQPTTSLGRANRILKECRDNATDERRRVIKFEFCRIISTDADGRYRY